MTEGVTLPGHNLVAALHAAAAAGGWLDRRAFVAGAVSVCHREVYSCAAAAATVLAAEGVQAYDRVLLALDDGLDLVAAFLGTIQLGAVAVLANPCAHVAELRAAEESARPALVVAESSLIEAFTATPVLPKPQFGHAMATARPAPVRSCSPDTEAYGQFTSGTTGRPKLVLHRHADPLVYDGAFGGPVLGLSVDDVVLSVSRMYFAYGLGNSVFYPLLHGATAVLTDARPSPEDTLRAVTDLGVTVLFAVPAFYAQLLAHADHTVVARVRLAVTAGEVLPPGLEARMVALVGRRLLNGIGSTEIGQTFASNAPHAWRAGTVGRSLPPYAVRVVTADGELVGAGEEGHLEVRGPTIGVGQSDGSTRAAPADWQPTGDLAVLDDDGFLRPTGRADDIEIVGGINIHPADIESVLSEHTLVREVAVCSTRSVDGETGLRAYVVREYADVDDAQLAAGLIATARERMTRYMVPKSVTFVPDLPRTNSGKLRRHVLRAMAARVPLEEERAEP